MVKRVSTHFVQLSPETVVGPPVFPRCEELTSFRTCSVRSRPRFITSTVGKNSTGTVEIFVTALTVTIVLATNERLPLNVPNVGLPSVPRNLGPKPIFVSWKNQYEEISST